MLVSQFLVIGPKGHTENQICIDFDCIEFPDDLLQLQRTESLLTTYHVLQLFALILSISQACVFKNQMYFRNQD